MPLSKQQLGSLLWGIADTGLRGKVEDYKAYILSLLFFKRLSDNYEWEAERRIGQFREQYDKELNQKQLTRLQDEGHAFVIPPMCFAERRKLAPAELQLFGEVFRIVPAPELGRKVILDESAKEIRSGRDLTDKKLQSHWCRAYAADHLSRRIKELSTAHSLPFNRLFIRSQHTKWGTCSAKGNMSLNWRLILTPRLVIDYVIMHELVHSKILNHSHGFWVHLRAVYPESDSAMQWLKQNRNIVSDIK